MINEPNTQPCPEGPKQRPARSIRRWNTTPADSPLDTFLDIAEEMGMARFLDQEAIAEAKRYLNEGYEPASS